MRKSTILVFGIIMGAAATFAVSQPWQMGGVAEAAGNADTYRQLNLFGDVFERVKADYVEEPEDSELVESAINGMLAALDPHSSYMSPKSYRDMQVQTRGEFGGLGIEVTMEDGLVKVVTPIDDTPAARAGVQAGDLITHLDGEAVQGLTLSEAVEKMRRPDQYADQAHHPARRLRGADRYRSGARHHSDPRGALQQRGRRRLRPDHPVQRADLRQSEVRARRARGRDPGRGPERLRRRPAQQSRRSARPGDRGFRRVPRPWRDRLHTRPHRRREPALQRPFRRPDQGQAGHRADQRRVRLGLRDRRRRPAGPPQGHRPRHPVLRQGLGPDDHTAGLERRPAADDGTLLHAVGVRSRPRASIPTSWSSRTCPRS